MAPTLLEENLKPDNNDSPKESTEDVSDSDSELAFEPVFESSDEEDNARIRALDMRTRSERTFKKELEIMAAMPAHNHSDNDLVNREPEWGIPYRVSSCTKSSYDFGCRTIDRLDYGELYTDQTMNASFTTSVKPGSPFHQSNAARVFEETYVDNVGRLCILRNMANFYDWPALEKWRDAETFVHNYGDIPIHITEMFDVTGLGKAFGVRIPLSKYINEYAKENEADFPFYPFERDFENEGRGVFLKDWSYPKLFEQDLYAAPGMRQ